jgi:hypothetical protein
MHTAGRGKSFDRPPLYTIKLKDNEVQVEAYNFLLKEFREKNPIPLDLPEAIPGLLAAAHLATIKAVKEVSGNTKQRIHAKYKERKSRRKDGYSPSARIMQDALQCMIEIRRAAFTRNTHRRWAHETFKSIIRPLVTRKYASMATPNSWVLPGC